ncbi:MAG: phage tail protein [Methylococcales bacterium]
MIELKLPFWLDGVELAKLTAAAQAWWETVEGWLLWPLGQTDALTCTPGILDMLAFQRDVQRFTDEPDDMYRRRVKYALVNAQDAGSKAGFIRIFARLGIGYVEVVERLDTINWDVIRLRLTDSQIAGNPELLMNIVLKYGRTCRRYEFETLAALPLTMPVWGVGHTWGYSVAGI